MDDDECQVTRIQGCGNKKKFIVCPECFGKGFVEDITFEKSSGGDNEMDEVKILANHTLPKIKGQVSKPQSKGNKQSWRLSDMALPVLPSKSNPCSRQNNATKSVPNCLNKFESFPLRRDSSQLSKDSNDSQKDYSIEYKEITNLSEFLKLTKTKLKSDNVNDIAAGVISTVHIARQGSDIAIILMPQVNRHLCTLLRSLKTYYVCIAFEAIKELYSIIPLISRPEFDEMIHLLLGKVSDLKPNIRDGANAALDVVAANTPPQYIVRAVLGKGPRSKNFHVRLTSARLLNHVVDSIGPDPLINAYNLKEMRRNIIECCLLFLEDQNADVRKVGKEITSKLMTVPEFEDVLLTDIPQKLFKRVEKIILNIKYEGQNV